VSENVELTPEERAELATLQERLGKYVWEDGLRPEDAEWDRLYELERRIDDPAFRRLWEYLYDEHRGAWGQEGQKYQRKFPLTEAQQWNGDNLAQMARFASPYPVQKIGNTLIVQTLTGGKILNRRDYVIRSFRILRDRGITYPLIRVMTCREFENIYEPAKEGK
jgi:hypothetical protein